MKLTPYNFIISYYLGKSNPVDTLLRRLDYEAIKEAINNLLPTL